MTSLNYKHLLYFQQVAQEGSVQAAAARLNVTPQTISGQLRLLEQQLGVALLRKSGRQLELTSAGRLALQYSRDIFALGDQLQQAMRQGDKPQPRELRVGIVDALAKSIAHQLLMPALTQEPLQLTCREQPMPDLLGELAVGKLDLVLADSPIPANMKIRCFSHLLGSSPLACFSAPSLQQVFHAPFPHCLQDAPLLLPTDTHSGVRASVLSWLSRHQLECRIAGEFDDSALLKAFGSQGHGFFFAPAVISQDISDKYGVTAVAVVDELQQSFYALYAERDNGNTSVQRIVDSAADYFASR
ncbi:LysR family transcriptional regulator [Bacterioplanes sanyensis]|uniref:LysR family transcriptional regulator n=1 Tax=Bacterioplanes sanyensis TaxID=1249553 RepID=A0A222FNI7_9GAMM|nr:LysR family transcriptional regulator [Bacterioplanes sanyensis]ASP40126.1 LysR family transcriptional regulator [Bacterioplanes sanyensis]